MGGRNHQPTHTGATASSAWLSKKIGEAVIALERANNHLEDAIIVAMRDIDPARIHLRVESQTVQKSLNESRMALLEMKGSLACIDDGFDALLQICNDLGYSGNALSSTLDDQEMLEHLKSHDILPHVNQEAWTEVAKQIQKFGILEALRWEQQQFQLLAVPTDRLIAVTQQCMDVAEQNDRNAFIDAIENNEIPYRHHYARVFSIWNHLQAMFLYSALMMTELYYRANGLGSLTTTNLSEPKLLT